MSYLIPTVTTEERKSFAISSAYLLLHVYNSKTLIVTNACTKKNYYFTTSFKRTTYGDDSRENLA